MKIPIVLALDGALGPFSVALLGGSHIATRVADGNDALERGISLVDEVCKEAGMTLGEVDAVAVGVGPGGFTGLRIALAFAKAFALAIERPLVGVSSFDVVDECSSTSDDEQPRALVLRPRANVYCVRVNDKENSMTVTGNLEHICATLAQYKRLTIAAIPHAATCEILAAGIDAELLTEVTILPALCIARHALRRIELHGIASLPPIHAISADYGEAPATTMPALQR